MNIDGRTMAGIKLGKPLIVLIKKDEPSMTWLTLLMVGLKAQLASLQKIAYEAYGITLEMKLTIALEKDPGMKAYDR
jgi:hypothetical protein